MKFSAQLNSEAIEKGSIPDSLCLDILSNFRKYRSKHYQAKWKIFQHHVRILLELNSIWFNTKQKFRIRWKKVGSSWKQPLREHFKEICIKKKNFDFFFSREFENWIYTRWETMIGVRNYLLDPLYKAHLIIFEDMGRKSGTIGTKFSKQISCKKRNITFSKDVANWCLN